MICPKCERRWAPFPNGDFKNVSGELLPTSEAAEDRRRSEFGRDEKEICEECDYARSLDLNE